MRGVGGAGTHSDGTLNLRPDIGGDLKKQTGDEKSTWELVNYTDSIFLELGANKKLHISTGKKIKELKKRTCSVGAKFIDINNVISARIRRLELLVTSKNILNIKRRIFARNGGL